MNLAAYLQYVAKSDRNRSLMARILLNTLGHAERFQVDISELRQLSPQNRAMTNAFEEWAHSQPGLVMQGAQLPCLESWACLRKPKILS